MILQKATRPCARQKRLSPSRAHQGSRFWRQQASCQSSPRPIKTLVGFRLVRLAYHRPGMFSGDQTLQVSPETETTNPNHIHIPAGKTKSRQPRINNCLFGFPLKRGDAWQQRINCSTSGTERFETLNAAASSSSPLLAAISRNAPSERRAKHYGVHLIAAAIMLKVHRQ